MDEAHKPDNSQIISYWYLRNAIGWIGLLMPTWVKFGAYFREDITFTNSISAYDYTSMRDAGDAFNFGPWLFKAVKSFNIPEAIWPTLGRKLFNQFGDLLRDIALLHDNLHVFDSANLVTTITPALPKTKDESGDWINEIHLTKAGYEKVSREWSKDIQFILP